MSPQANIPFLINCPLSLQHLPYEITYFKSTSFAKDGIMAYSMSLKHANNRTGLIAMVSIYSLLIITAVAFRFYARRLVSVGFGTDDWLALGGLVSMTNSLHISMAYI